MLDRISENLTVVWVMFVVEATMEAPSTHSYLQQPVFCQEFQAFCPEFQAFCQERPAFYL